jgi:hypothetical protein
MAHGSQNGNRGQLVIYSLGDLYKPGLGHLVLMLQTMMPKASRALTPCPCPCMAVRKRMWEWSRVRGGIGPCTPAPDLPPLRGPTAGPVATPVQGPVFTGQLNNRRQTQLFCA